MALPAVGSALYQTPEEILAQLLADYRSAHAAAGITVNVSVGSEPHFRMRAIANRVAQAYQNNKLALKDISPLDATGDALVELAAVYGVTKRPASNASGFISITSTGLVSIPQGWELSSAPGATYETVSAVTVDGSVAGGAAVEVIATIEGTDGNSKAGTIVTWDDVSIGALAHTAVVGIPSVNPVGDIDGGNPEDDDETLRARFLRRLARPGVGGNPAYVESLAEGATAAVEKAFVFSGVRGAASYDVAVTKKGTDRTLSTANINLVAQAILADMPGSADLNVTSVAEQQIDVILNATLPLPINAGGAGSGWRDAIPWPSTNEQGVNVFGEITAIAGNTITVNSTSAAPGDTPVAGQRFGIWDPVARLMSEYTIQSVAGGSGAYVLTIDQTQSDSLSFVTTGMFCSAGAENLKAYAAAFLAAMEGLGPGEKTTDVDILPRGRRVPGPDEESPSDITSLQTGVLLPSFDSEGDPAGFLEILNLTYAGRFETGTYTTRTSPAVPSTTADPPRQLTLRRFSIRRQV